MGVSWDLLIRRGLIINGSGSQGAIGDLAVADGRITALGAAVPGDAKKIVDADGLAVTPGFIDIKTHSDFVLPINPKAESKVRQGVTTEIVGHCGFSVAPAALMVIKADCLHNAGVISDGEKQWVHSRARLFLADGTLKDAA
jgi:N-acyl-D-aspartate/D-glutamate deacylase